MDLLKDGLSYIEIAKELSISERTCKRWRCKLKEDWEWGSMMPMYNGPGSNGMERVNTVESKPVAGSKDGKAVIVKDPVTVVIERFEMLNYGLRVSALKLFDMFKLKFTAMNRYGESAQQTCVSITLDEYMRLLGKPNTEKSREKARITAKEDLDALFSVRLSWKEKNGAKARYDMRICYKQKVTNSEMHFWFTPDFAGYLANSYVTHYPMSLLKLDERNPNSYYLGKKLSLHYSIRNNVEDGTNDIISVRSLLAYCDDLIPSYEDVMNGDRNCKKHIVKPFLRGMKALSDAGVIRWELCGSKKQPCEIASEEITYCELENLYVKFDVVQQAMHTS
jgi:hypothetical protein